jgi:hypothetical protein
MAEGKPMYKRYLFFLAPDGSNGGGDPNANGNGSQGNQQQNTPNAGGNGGAPAREELNKQFAERAKRAEEATRKQLWESLGVTSQEEFDAFVKEKKEAEDKNKSELQRLADRAAQEKARADKLSSERKAEVESLQKRIVDSEIKLLASVPVLDKDGKVVRAAFRADALADVAVLIDRSNIKDENGKIIGIDKALEDLAKSKPWMLAETKQQNNSQHIGTPPLSNPQKPIQQGDQGKPVPTWTL